MNPPRPPRPSFIDARVLLAALVVASPAAVRVSQGLLSVDELLVRYLVIAAGCAVVGALVRWAWPLVAGDGATPDAPGGAEPAARPDLVAATEDLVAGDVFEGLDDLGGEAGLEPAHPTAGTTHSNVVP